MRYILMLIVMPILMVVLLSACGVDRVSPITPSPDKNTFLFFLTDP